MQPVSSDPAPHPSPVRPASVRYLGFRCTDEGRSYTLQIDGHDSRRVVTVDIPSALFASGHARYQDAPDLIFSKLQRELARDALLPDGARIELSHEDTELHRLSRETPQRKRRARPPVVE
jgi:hypothetical protein